MDPVKVNLRCESLGIAVMTVTIVFCFVLFFTVGIFGGPQYVKTFFQTCLNVPVLVGSENNLSKRIQNPLKSCEKCVTGISISN